ncbi:unnamed protein product [Tilletia laevis]|nr:unnamed protein product [Tilletia laevis]
MCKQYVTERDEETETYHWWNAYHKMVCARERQTKMRHGEDDDMDGEDQWDEWEERDEDEDDELADEDESDDSNGEEEDEGGDEEEGEGGEDGEDGEGGEQEGDLDQEVAADLEDDVHVDLEEGDIDQEEVAAESEDEIDIDQEVAAESEDEVDFDQKIPAESDDEGDVDLEEGDIDQEVVSESEDEIDIGQEEVDLDQKSGDFGQAITAGKLMKAGPSERGKTEEAEGRADGSGGEDEDGRDEVADGMDMEQDDFQDVGRENPTQDHRVDDGIEVDDCNGDKDKDGGDKREWNQCENNRAIPSTALVFTAKHEPVLYENNKDWHAIIPTAACTAASTSSLENGKELQAIIPTAACTTASASSSSSTALILHQQGREKHKHKQNHKHDKVRSSRHSTKDKNGLRRTKIVEKERTKRREAKWEAKVKIKQQELVFDMVSKQGLLIEQVLQTFGSPSRSSGAPTS